MGNAMSGLIIDKIKKVLDEFECRQKINNLNSTMDIR